MHHELKILPLYFDQVIAGNKPFEIRDNTDRNFKGGDTVTLNEWDRENYTGRKTTCQITFVTAYAQQPGFVVFGMREMELEFTPEIKKHLLAMLKQPGAVVLGMRPAEPAQEIKQRLLALGEKVDQLSNMATGGIREVQHDPAN